MLGHGNWFWFWFWFLDTILSPCGGHPFTGKDLGSSHSTLCFHRDSKVSIDSNDILPSNTIINKIGNNIRTYPAMQPQAAANLNKCFQLPSHIPTHLSDVWISNSDRSPGRPTGPKGTKGTGPRAITLKYPYPCWPLTLTYPRK